MDDVTRSAELALARCRTRHAPDDRVQVFELDASVADGAVAVSGVVSGAFLRERALAAVERAVDGQGDGRGDVRVVDEVTLLEADAVERVVAVPRLACRRAPSSDAERVTELVYGQVVPALDQRGEWRRVRTPSGYVAWVREDDLTTPADVDPDAIVDVAALSGTGPVGTLYGGTPCERREQGADGVTVAFATGAEAVLPPSAVTAPTVPADGEAVVATATEYLGTDYGWGGMTVDGIDCSGLVWMAYRRNGLVLPRDADQQRAAGRPVERDELRPGDLLFFPGHVAISTGGRGIVHAESAAGGVVHASIDHRSDSDGDGHGPDDGDDGPYNERLDDEFEAARRLV